MRRALLALGRWGAPALSQLYADTAGTIAWLPAGFAPLRPNWDGPLPVPGDGRYAWRGHLSRAAVERSVERTIRLIPL